jgi:hypothetical protein
MKFFCLHGNNRKHNRMEGDCMRHSANANMAHLGENQVLSVDLHDFIQKEQSSNMIELASEFGLSLRDVKKLKKQLERS